MAGNPNKFDLTSETIPGVIARLHTLCDGKLLSIARPDYGEMLPLLEADCTLLSVTFKTGTDGQDEFFVHFQSSEGKPLIWEYEVSQQQKNSGGHASFTSNQVCLSKPIDSRVRDLDYFIIAVQGT